MHDYHAISMHVMNGQARVARPSQMDQRVTMESPALDVMTDLSQVFAAVVDPGATMASAQHYMIQRGVRMLLALNRDKTLAGLITATDIMGEKPVRLIEERRISHAELLVSDAMTPADRIDAMELPDVRSARVGHVVASLKDAGRQHALVLERVDNAQVIRGIFSLSQIARQLGVSITITHVARTFAEIESALMADLAIG